MIGVLLGVLVGWMPLTLGLGVLFGGVVGHLVSPPRDPLARRAAGGSDGYAAGGASDFSWMGGGSDSGSDTDCGDSGSDGGGCDGGGGDGGGGGD
jgi:hypothetical protein